MDVLLLLLLLVLTLLTLSLILKVVIFKRKKKCFMIKHPDKYLNEKTFRTEEEIQSDAIRFVSCLRDVDEEEEDKRRRGGFFFCHWTLIT